MSLLDRYRSPVDVVDASGTPFAHDDRNALARYLMPRIGPQGVAASDPAYWPQRLGIPHDSDEYWAQADGSPWKRSATQNALVKVAEALNTPTGLVLSNFLGPAARTADRNALAKAKTAAAAGASRERIWNEFGWFQGRDGKWRFEIDTSNAQFSATELGKTKPLSSVLRHNELYAAYPDLNKAFVSPTTGGAAGLWDPRTGTIYVNRTYRDPKSVALHEAQHAVQDLEGFARGGSPSGVTPTQIAAERSRVGAQRDPDPTGWTSVGTASGDMSDAQIAHELYRRLAGEVEARTVQKRMNLTPAERRSRPPWLDYDVPVDMQIVR